jgi:N-acetylneuraminate synthase
MGAAIIEKHFTLDRKGGGPDDSFSLEPQELTALCNDTKTAWQAMGEVDYGRKSSEQGNVVFRRSLYFVKPLQAGEVITAEHIKSIRPGFGLPPKEWDNVVGKCAKMAIAYGTPVSRDLLV